MTILRRWSAMLLALALAGCTGGASSPAPSSSTPGATPTAATTSPSVTAAPSAVATPRVARASAQIKVGGVTRHYIVVTPPDVAEHDPLPLLFVLHGWTQTMNDAESISGFDAIAADPGAVVVYPQGYGHSWNAGGCCEPASVDGIDDVGFFAALMDKMEADYPVDPNRVFVAGGSNGGEMAERLACDLAGRVAAIGDVIGTLLVDCQPSQPVSVIAIHGMADVQIPIGGGRTDDPSCASTPCPAFAVVMERWRQLDGCSGDPTVTADAYTSETTWTSCDAGTAVTFITAIGRGHGWYTSHPDDRAVTWDFFMNHPRSAPAG